MSEQLLRAIEKVQSDIAQHPDAFQLEEQTIRSLIDPVLNALGWRVNEVNRVRQQYPVGRGKVDMALMRDNKPVVLVEAKALGKSLDDAVTDQVSQYCYREGAQTALLTNGTEWRVYRPLLMKLTFEQRMLFCLRLDQQDAVDVAAKLSLLHHDKIEQLPKEDLRILLDAYWDSYGKEELLNAFSGTLREYLVKWSDKGPGEIPAGKVKTWLRKKMFSGQFAASTQTQQRKQPPPVPPDGYAVIIDGERFAVRAMTEAMQCVANWLIQRGHVTREECPITLSDRTRNRYFIHTSPKHPDGNNFRSSMPLANGLYLEAHSSRSQNIGYAYRLLARCGYPKDILQFAGFNG